MQTRPIAIEIHQASKTYRAGRSALDKVNTRISTGEFVGLLGASGSGKSTLLRALCGLENLDSAAGEIKIDGQVLQSRGRLSRNVRQLRHQTGIIFQQFNLVGRMDVLTNVLTGLLPRMPLWRSLSRHFSEEERLLAYQALDMVGLTELAGQRASTLSGGQQQRAAIARTLVQGARILLADEPVASLDPESTRRVMDILHGLSRDQGITVVVSLHNVSLARQYCDRIIALRQGELVYDGTPGGLDDMRLHQLYGSQTLELIEPSQSEAKSPLAQNP
jgi:phosphonate transport system ATP-binding protein